MSDYGRVGVDVGVVGRWVRLVMGIAILTLAGADLFGGGHTHSGTTKVLIGVLFFGYVASYLGIYRLVVNRLEGESPWIATVLFVSPAIYLTVVNEMMPPEWSLGALIGIPAINHPSTIAMLFYIGVSFLVQFFTKYGGCEVIAIQNLIYRRPCPSYCVPLLPLDVAEKAIAERLGRRARKSFLLLVLPFTLAQGGCKLESARVLPIHENYDREFVVFASDGNELTAAAAGGGEGVGMPNAPSRGESLVRATDIEDEIGVLAAEHRRMRPGRRAMRLHLELLVLPHHAHKPIVSFTSIADLIAS